ncbi:MULTISPECIES: sugar phosphate isomerase/epimerase [unclassified Arenibacter]|jgi:inosose dehydratase|uniref:sugar phosphate isomerase/epimerase family protein n=1 Tax=unclassified Arenibacter TaxID=2615047 RepID=UPI000E344230|nr:MULTISPECIES: sugar phosphate isomerase/epimerase [unclassified Arenibacter]MCM4162498.1 xylose isomerase [Arenibacter sp. A80]RFT58083.1 xylose isomerase [Arenibacter sp. P308M17]
MMKIANAPCSWGALEFDLEEKSEEIGFEQVLDEIRETGYMGTELGDWGYMPTTPGLLRAELDKRELDLLGAFVPVALANAPSHEAGMESALKVAELMFNAGYEKSFIVLADDNGSVPGRTNNAGRITPEMGLTEKQWKGYAAGAEKIARAVKDAYGIRTVFHHHCAGYVETPEEIDTLMTLTDPELLGLCLDMGHYAFGGGDPVKALTKYGKRIWHVHFKDYSQEAAKASREANGDYFDAIKRGVFCELGKGSVDFRAVVKLLEVIDYKDWIVVEQDILPGMGNPKVCAQANRDYIRSLGL